MTAKTTLARFEDRKLDDHVPIAKTFLPEEYGRGVDLAHVKKIVSNFDARAFDRIKVSMRDDGRFAVIDGNHRREAASILGFTEIPCVVFIDLAPEEEAELFRFFNTSKSHTALGLEKALIAERDKGAIERRQVLKRNGLDWAFGGVHEYAHVQCAAAIRDVYENHGLTILADVIRVMVEGFGTRARRAFIQPTVAGMTLFWIRYRYTLTEERLLSQLHTSDALELMSRARILATANNETAAVGFGRAVLELYNKGLSKNALDPWQTSFLSEKARQTAPERQRKGIERRRQRGEDFAATVRKSWETRKGAAS